MSITVTLNNVGSLADTTTAATTINNNNATLTTALSKALSTAGEASNQMNTPLDMNSNQIVNLPSPGTSTSPLRLQDLNSFVGGGTVTNIPSGGTTGQVLAKNSNTSYQVGWTNSVTSVGLALPSDFTVTNSPVTTTGNLTGAWAVAPTGTGALVKATSPVLTTPSLGAATATSVNKVALTAPATASTLTIADGKTLTANNTLTLAGTDATTFTFPTTSGTVDTTSATATLTNKTIDTAGPNTIKIAGTALTAVSGTGNVVLSTSPTLVTPALGTPASGVLTNCTGTAAGLTAGNVTTNANLTGPITSVGNATAVAAQTGTGTTFVMNTSPTLVTPNIGAATATTVNGATIDNNAWTTYTPTFTATSGTATVAGRWKALGKTIFVSINITLTSAVTGTLSVTLPSNSVVNAAISGQVSSSGIGAVGYVAAGTNSMSVLTSPGGQITTNGSMVTLTGLYEST